MPDDILESKPFDYEAWVRDARLGYEEVIAKRKDAALRMEEAQREVATLDGQIEKLSAMLDALGVVPEESLARPRRGNLSAVVHDVVTSHFVQDTSMITEVNLIAKVKERIPDAIDKSVQSALSRLAKTGTGLRRHGKRGSYTYSYPGMDPIPDSVADPVPS